MFTSHAIAVLEKCNITIDYENGKLEKIFCKDLTDRYNEPCIYTKTKRGLDKAVVEVIRIVSEKKQETTIRDLQDLFDSMNIRTHYYCAMD